MTRILARLILATLSAQCLQAQLSLLTLREAESIVERIPEVLNAQKNRDCPELLPNYESPEELEVQVRSTCGSDSGMLIGHYLVNRRTGDIALWGDDPQPVASIEGKAFIAGLVAQARRRILSTREARCLVVEAARSLPGWTGVDAIVSAKPFGELDRIASTMQFTASRSSRTRPTEIGRMLTVNLSSALVRDDETGLNIMSLGVGSLTSQMLELRAPHWLSDADALSVALLVPRVERNLRDGCKLYAGGAFYSHQALLGVSCAGKSIKDSNVLIDLLSGDVTDPQTGKAQASAEATRLAREVLEGIERHAADLQKEIEVACGRM